MRGERGQAVVELGIILLLLTVLTGGVVDGSRALYEYNLVAAGARYGARWASVVGGLCAVPTGASTNDWCDQLSTSSASFWSQPGNAPLQGAGVPCPATLTSSFTGYYTASTYLRSTATTIVGAIAQHFDTSSQSTDFISGELTPGFDLRLLKVCIQLTWNSTLGSWAAQPGDKVEVWVYYPYQPVSTLLSAVHQVNLVASSQYRID